jgi:hypothetical protein
MMPVPLPTERWEIVTRDDAAVLQALDRGECDGLLPDAWHGPDDLLHFALDLGLFTQFADFPDRRHRRTHPKDAYCKVLLGGLLLDQRSLEAVGRVLFTSAVTLDQFGLNLRATRAGGVRTGDARPFDMEALADFFAQLEPADYAAHQQRLSAWLRRQRPLRGHTFALDCVDARLPTGHHAPARHWKTAVLSVLTPHGAVPLLWEFGPAPDTGDLTLAKPLVQAAQTAWGAGAITTLIMDAGFLDGDWLRTLATAGLQVIIRVRENMDPVQAAVAAAPTRRDWQRVPLPQRPVTATRPPLRRREILGFPDWPGWEAYDGNLALCLVRDTYADGTVDYWAIMSSTATHAAREIYDLFQRRWAIEEQFMALARYHYFNALGACRDGVALAKVHFLLLAYTARMLCRLRAAAQERAAGCPQPWRHHVNRFVVYWGPYYAILLPSVVMTAFLRYPDRWQASREEVLAAIRYLET